MTKYIHKELAKYWPVSKKLMTQYNDLSHTIKDRNGTFWWYQNNQLHRDDDNPAKILADGTLYWYQDGQEHRDGDKPAIIHNRGSLYWYQNGLRHRMCGPSIIHPDTSWWYINDKNITGEVHIWLAGEEWQGTPEQIVEFKLRFT